MKKDDIVEFKIDRGELQQGRIIWVKDENVGVIINDHLKPHQREAVVMPLQECTLVKTEMSKLTDNDLIASIKRLQGMRFPRKVNVRKRSQGIPTKRHSVAKAMELLEGMDEDVINELVQKALKEEKE